MFINDVWSQILHLENNCHSLHIILGPLNEDGNNKIEWEASPFAHDCFIPEKLHKCWMCTLTTSMLWAFLDYKSFKVLFFRIVLLRAQRIA